MARYIDADKLIAHLKDEIEGCKQPFGSRANGKGIAYGTELGLKSAISFAETLSTADVVPKSEVEALLKENERWMMEYADYRAEVNSIIEKAKQEVAREIFEELDERFVWTDGDYYMSFPYFVYAELKKKYTESEGEYGRDSNIQSSS